jgi:hypothetical protein
MVSSVLRDQMQEKQTLAYPPRATDLHTHPTTHVRRNLQMQTIKEEIRRYSSQYSAHLSAHPNDLIVNLIELPDNRRLRRHLPNDLPTRFLV